MRAEIRPLGHRAIAALRTRTARQAAFNAVSTGAVSLLSAIFTAVAARHLTSARLGSLQFALSLLQFVAVFFEFGIALPAARIAARRGPADHGRVVGATLVAFAPVGLLFSLLVFAVSFVIDDWSHVQAGSALRVTALIAAAYPFQLISLQLSQGLGRLHVASLTNLLGQVAAVGALLYVATIGAPLTVTSALWVRGGGMLLGGVLFSVWLRPRLQRVSAEVRAIVRQAREYGFSIYLGRIFGTATYNMDVLMIGVLSSARAVGLYTLAGALCRVTLLPVVGATAALFRRMVHEPRIPAIWLRLAAATGVVGVVGLIFLGPTAIDLLFSTRYHAAAAYLVPLGAAEATRGLTLVYNTFLSAQGRGRDLRNTGLLLTGSNLILNFALIPPFGATGAAWASLAALVANLLAHQYYYRRASARPKTTAVDG